MAIPELTRDLAARLAAYFPRDAVKWRIQGKVIEKQGQPARARVVAFLDAVTVMDRLDDVLGPEGYDFDWSAGIVSGNDLMTARGVLTIGGSQRADLGEAGNNEKSKGAVRDALKRAAVLYGIGRYLHRIGTAYADLVEQGGQWVIDPRELPRLAELLPAPEGDQPRKYAAPELVNILCVWYGDQHRPAFEKLSNDQAVAQIVKATPAPAKKKAG